ncbi:MAG: hypothetical protein J6P03_03485 [Opitutales bacterium]|nr:hypothetical protein [Opitutales bacterium]
MDIVFLALFVFFFFRLVKSLLTPKEELWYKYRATIDLGVRDFRHRLRKSRMQNAVLSIIFAAALAYYYFSAK